jgi:integrase
MRKLTATALQALLRKPPAKRVDLMDGAVPGLMLRIGPGGATWSLRIRVVGEGGVTPRGHQRKGNKARVTLGEYPAISIEAARGLANTYLDQAKKGVSPIAALESVATAGGLNVKALSQRFIDDYVRLKELRALNKYEGAVRVHIVPLLGEVLADRLSREHVRGLVRKAMVRVPRGQGPRDRPRGGKEAARSALGVLRKMINWGTREGLLKRTDNPATGMEDNLPKQKQKERVLSLGEARLAWRAAGTLGYPFGPTYQLILLTGCRPGEWSACLQSYVDLSQALLVIPADAYKSNHVHVVPLVPRAVSILENAVAHRGGARGEYVFSGTDGEKPLSGWTKGHARMMRAICALSGDRPAVRWTPHDLRRTVATRIAEKLGVGGEQLIQRVLGHSDGSVTAIYNRYGYVREMRSVLEQWAMDLTADESRLTIFPPESSALASAASRTTEAA